MEAKLFLSENLEKEYSEDVNIYEIEMNFADLISKNPKGPYELYLGSLIYTRLYKTHPNEFKYLNNSFLLNQQNKELNPNHIFSLLSQYFLETNFGQTVEAQKIFQKIVQNYPTHWRSTWISLLSISNQNTHISAQSYFKKTFYILKNTDNFSLTLISLVSKALSVYDSKALVSHIEKIQNQYSNSFTNFILAQLFNETGKTSKALALLRVPQEHILIVHNSNLQILEGKILAQFPETRSQGLNLLSKLAFSNPSEKIHKILGEIYLDTNPNEGLQHYAQALELSQNPLTLLYELAEKFSNHKNIRTSLLGLDYLILKYPHHDFLYSIKAQKQLYSGHNIKQALETIMQGILINPQNEQLYSVLGLIHYENKDFQRSLLAFNEAIRLNTFDSSALYNKACVLSLLGQLEMSLFFLKKAIITKPSLVLQAAHDPDFENLKQHKEFKLTLKIQQNFTQDISE